MCKDNKLTAKPPPKTAVRVLRIRVGDIGEASLCLFPGSQRHHCLWKAEELKIHCLRCP